MSQATKEDIQGQIDIIFKQDFENMPIEQLQVAQNDIAGLFSTSHKNRYEIRLTDEQLAKKYILDYLLSKDEYKDDSVKVGDIWHSSWGYDQTNTEYFKVKSISKTEKSCSAVMISFETVPGSEGFMCDKITPIPEKEVHNGQECTVRISRSSIWNPIKKQHEKIGQIYLRGSVFYSSCDDKHLQNLYRVDPTKSEYRSWYA